MNVEVRGKDNRIRVPKGYVETATKIGMIYQPSTATAGAACTAFCVDDDIVATNAHCLVVRDGHKVRGLDDIIFIIPPTGARKDSSVHNWLSSHSNIAQLSVATANEPRISFYAGYSSGGDAQQSMAHDWAFAKLRQPACEGRILAFETPTASTMKRAAKEKRISMIGFHRDKAFGERWFSPDCEIKSRYRERLFEHTCDSEKGSSGSPILMRRKDGEIVVIGINAGSISYRQYRVSIDPITKREVGRRKLVSSYWNNVAVPASTFERGLSTFRSARLLTNESEFREFQTHLRELKLYRGQIDGLYGPMTRDATLKFEQRVNNNAIGLPSQQLLEILRKTAQPSATN